MGAAPKPCSSGNLRLLIPHGGACRALGTVLDSVPSSLGPNPAVRWAGPALLASPFPCGYVEAQGRPGRAGVGQCVLGMCWPPAAPSLVSEASPGQGPAERAQPCSPQHVCLIEEWDGEDPTLTVPRRRLHTQAVEEEPRALVRAGGPVQPLLSSQLRPRVQSACLVVCLSLRRMAGRWAALVSGSSCGGPVLSCPEVSCLRGQAHEVGGCCVHVLGMRASDSGRLNECG